MIYGCERDILKCILSLELSVTVSKEKIQESSEIFKNDITAFFSFFFNRSTYAKENIKVCNNARHNYGLKLQW